MQIQEISFTSDFIWTTPFDWFKMESNIDRDDLLIISVQSQPNEKPKEKTLIFKTKNVVWRSWWRGVDAEIQFHQIWKKKITRTNELVERKRWAVPYIMRGPCI